MKSLPLSLTKHKVKYFKSFVIFPSFTWRIHFFSLLLHPEMKSDKRQMTTAYAYERLKECGINPSKQRVAIMDYLLTHPTHPTVEEVFNALTPQIRTLSRTTVYNTLRFFSERNAAQMITIDDHRVCYDGNTAPHIHFFCKECGKVYDLMEEPVPAMKYTGVPQGFTVQDTQFYYRGICAACAAKAASEQQAVENEKEQETTGEQYAN